MSEASAFRSVLVSSHLGKCVHKALRCHSYEMFDTYLHACQLGGRRHIPVTLCGHYGRSFLRWQRQQGGSCALLMLDLKEAFYRVFRPLTMNIQWTDEGLCQVFAALNLPPSTLDELRYHLRQPTALAQAQVPPFLQQTIRAVHEDTWFVVGNQPDVTRTSLGSRPGDSFADTIFSFTFAKVLFQIEARLDQAGLLTYVPDAAPGIHSEPIATSHGALGSVWMDDACFFITAPSASVLESRSCLAASLVIDSCRDFGFVPNLSPGKSEILMAPRGPGSQKVKTRLFGPIANGFLSVVGEHQSDQLKIVANYQHLGGILCYDGKLGSEVRRRLALAHQAFTLHRKLLYHNKALTWKQRSQLFQSLVLSKLCFGFETWVFHDQRTWKSFRSSVLRLFRRLLKCPHDDHLSEASLLAQCELPSPETLLRRARLRYYGHLWVLGSRVDWGLLGLDHSWLALVRDDLAWMWSQLSRSSALRDPACHIDQWHELMTHRPKFWKRLINRAVRHEVRQHARLHQVAEAQRFILELLRSHDFTVPEVLPVPTADQAPAFFGCLQCAKSFKSLGGQGAHMFRTHGISAKCRQLFNGTSCGACLKEYHTFGKLKAHLHRQTTCRQTLLGRRLHLSPAPGCGSSQDQALARAHAGLCPVVQGAGPHPQPTRMIDFDNVHYAFVDAIADLLLQEHPLPELGPMIKALARQFPLSWTELIGSCQHASLTYGEEEASIAGYDIQEIESLLRTLQQPDQWPWSSSPPPSTSEECFYTQEELFAEIASRDVGLRRRQPTPSRGVGQVRYLLHAFSGRRRFGDVQYFLDALSKKHPHCRIEVLSIDIIIDQDLGNLAEPSTQAHWLMGMDTGYVVGILAGPPCNTWSRARNRELEPTDLSHSTPSSQRHGPRPLRDALHPWGKECTSLKELEQLILGNNFMLFVVKALFVLYVRGSVGLMEHPDWLEPADDKPLEECPASIWKVPVINALLRCEGVQLHHVSQGLFGAESNKPTGLLAIHLPTLPKELELWKVTRASWTEKSFGLNQAGQFNTARLKEYPPALCAALAAALDNAIAAVPLDRRQQIPARFCETCDSMISFVKGHCIGLDLHGF